MVTNIEWNDVRVRLPEEDEGEFLVLLIHGGIINCHYYKGLWNAYPDYRASALKDGDAIAWAEIPKELKRFSDEIWKECHHD